MKLIIKSMIWNTRQEKAFNQNSRKKKELKKKKDRLKNLWNNFKHTNIQIIGVSEGEEEEQEIENLFEKIMKENFPKVPKEIVTQVQEAQRVPNKLDPKRTTSRHFIIKMPKVRGKETILKAAREKQRVPKKEFPSDSQLISKKKLCKLKGTGKEYSK